MKRHFEDELKELKERLLYMGSLVEERIYKSIKALVDRNEEECREIAATDDLVNDLHIEIDDRCLRLLALRQPIAIDLRFITAAMKINSDLERMGDLAVNIAENVLILLKGPFIKPLIDVPRMAVIAEKMLKDSLDAFVSKDVELARSVILRDDEVDALKDQVFRELLTYMIADAKTIPRALSLILVSRHLERIADHATNIAEDVIYMVLGKDIRHHAEEKEN
ncbi:MAG: phosphate transport system regulatory protein PhoU [Candidatus Schekmanbacteria bacterium RIFCSPHIGHO2_02_FULL_38_11]|nr:MAG: phosphate transport system regulatory protein PhoU [Candidatus Schekmanbacteria bacterium RIFCSPHIGHO2_02_FULL_38_11]